MGRLIQKCSKSAAVAIAAVAVWIIYGYAGGNAVRADVPNPTDASAPHAMTAEHDGQHDFDFIEGRWKIHLSKLQNPLTGSKQWVEFAGKSVGRKIWGGRANLDEFEVNSPTGPIEGLTVRLYNPTTHQWRIYWANNKNAAIDPAPQIGEFKNGRGEFYGQDTLNGKLIYVRYVWSNTNTDKPHFEQSFSADGGKTWEVNWITDQTRADLQ